MARGEFDQAKAQLESALGEPIVQCVGVSPAGQELLSFGDSDSPFWRPNLTVNGQPHTPVPRAMFLILTPTRVAISGLRNYAPQVDTPILTLQRGDAEIIAGQNHSRGMSTYSMRSRASGAELDVELQASAGIAAELAEQLREFSVTPTAPDGPPQPGYNLWSASRRTRRSNALAAIGAFVLSLAVLGIGAHSVYAYHAGTPTKATIVSCSNSNRTGRTCRGTWAINGESHRSRINGKLDDSQKVGSSVDVHVFGGRAYTAAQDKKWFMAAGVFGGVGLFLLLFPLYRKRDLSLAGSVSIMREKRQRAEQHAPAADSLAPQYPIESVDNALKLLLLLGEQPQIRLSEATRYLGVASSTAHRLLAMLAYRGFVRQDPASKAYLPGPALTSVAFAIFGRIDVQRTATPIMRGLSERLRESIHVGTLDGANVRFVAAVEGPAAVRVASRLGLTMPAHCTSTGKVMLAQLPERELRQLLPHEKLERITPHSIGSRTELEAELSAVRERGYAVNREESEEGVASVAVAIPTRAPGLRLALNAAAPVNRLDRAHYPSVAAAIVNAAEEIGDQLG